MKIDINKANAAIDDYIAQLRDPKQIFTRNISSLHYVKYILERHGVIASARGMDIMDHCVLFATCVIACKRVREVSRIEVEQHAVPRGHSLQKTINAWRRHRPAQQHFVDRINQHLSDTGVATL